MGGTVLGRAIYEAVKKLNGEAPSPNMLEGWNDPDIHWVSPQQLRHAALKLCEVVRGGLPEAEIVLRTYDFCTDKVELLADQFLSDLEDIIAMTRFAEENGVTEMKLEIPL